MRTATRHWIEPLQILEKIGRPEGLRAFVQDGLECGFSRQEVAELYGTFFEDRLTEALALATASGDYPESSEFAGRVAEVLRVPTMLFNTGALGRRVLPVDEQYLACFREALIAIEGAFHRFSEGDYPSDAAVGVLLRDAHAAVAAGNLARAYDRVTIAGARVLEGEYLARPTDWMDAEPLYSWLIGLERIAQVRTRLHGWPMGPRSDWPDDVRPQIVWRVDTARAASNITPARKKVLQLLAAADLTRVELARMRRNRRWIGPELLRLLRMSEGYTSPTILRNVVRTLGAVTFLPAVDDLLGLMMRTAGAGDEALRSACEEALHQFGAGIKDRLLYHFELALTDAQRLALARVSLAIPEDDDVLDRLRGLLEQLDSRAGQSEAIELLSRYRHSHSRQVLMQRLELAAKRGEVETYRALRRVLASGRKRKVQA